jgi:predicted dehydrogenase
MEAFKLAKQKNLSVVCGFAHRYEPTTVEAVRRVHDGAIGDIVTISTDYLTGGRWMNPRLPDWDDMQWQLRDWRYFCWLSGDFVNCDAIASLDRTLWLMNDAPPAKVSAAGGRSQRTDSAYGNIYDHFNATIEWPAGQRCHFACRQWNDADQRVAETAFGTFGTAELLPPQITGPRAWRAKPTENMHESEQKALLNVVRTGQPINDGDLLVRATVTALMVRTSAYTGKTVFWDRPAATAAKAPSDAPVIWDSQQDLTPPAYEFGPLPVAPVPVPGQTKFL